MGREAQVVSLSRRINGCPRQPPIVSERARDVKDLDTIPQQSNGYTRHSLRAKPPTSLRHDPDAIPAPARPLPYALNQRSTVARNAASSTIGFDT
jgi:hypothetical protein